MALRVFEGFDHYSSQADLQARKGFLQWNDIALGLDATIGYETGRGGFGYAVALGGSSDGVSWLGGAFGANFSSAYVGVALQVQPITPSYIDVHAVDYTAGVVQITFRMIPSSGSLLVYLGDPTTTGYSVAPIYSSPPNAFSPYIWNKVEFNLVVGSSGSFDFHVQGASVASASGVNTSASGNNFFNGVRIKSGQTGSGSGTAVLIDDFNVNDTTAGPGTYPLNGFIGDCATRTLFTTANQSVQWTPLANANWQEVGETQFDRDTSYNYATTVGNTDLFTFGSLPTTVTTVFGVQLTGGYRKQDASAQTIVQVFHSGGTVANGTAWPISIDWAFYTDLLVVDPNTSATWTPTAVNALIGGYKLNS